LSVLKGEVKEEAMVKKGKEATVGKEFLKTARSCPHLRHNLILLRPMHSQHQLHLRLDLNLLAEEVLSMASVKVG
jgi:hypothetical protein